MRRAQFGDIRPAAGAVCPQAGEGVKVVGEVAGHFCCQPKYRMLNGLLKRFLPVPVNHHHCQGIEFAVGKQLLFALVFFLLILTLIKHRLIRNYCFGTFLHGYIITSQ